MVETQTISEAEVAALDKEVNAKLAAETTRNNEDLARKIREEVEKEFKQKQEFEQLQANQKKLQEDLKKAQEEATKAREESEKRSKELEVAFKKQLEDALVTKGGRGIAAGNGASPFENFNTSTNAQLSSTQRRLADGTIIDVSKMSRDELKAMEDASADAFYREVLGRPPPPMLPKY